MNKELQKLLKQINDKKNEVKSLVNDGKLDKARAAKEELVELQNRFDLLYDLDEDEQDGIENKVKDGTAKQVGGDVKPDKKNIVKSFVNIVKAGFLHKEADEADIKVYKDALTSDTTLVGCIAFDDISGALEILQEIGITGAMFDELKEIIEEMRKGVPLGYFTSQWFGNFYLKALDHYIKEELHAEHYMRYMDDMVILGKSKKKLHKIHAAIETYLNDNLDLEIKTACFE